jgi:hypothetical protein
MTTTQAAGPATKRTAFGLLLVALSTLTTKQHFVVDVVGGILVAEAVARHVFEPWDEGRLSLRVAWREMRRLCERLDAGARDPGNLRLLAHDLHPRLRRLVESAARDRSLASLCATAPGRRGLIERERHLAAQLRGSRVAVATLVASAPAWLQFLRLVEDSDGGLTEDRVVEHVARLDDGLVAALRAVFDAPAPAEAQPTRLQSMLPASGATT